MQDESSPLLADADCERSSSYTTPPTDLPVDSEVTKPAPNVAAVLIPLAVGVFLVAMDATIVVSSYATIGTELNQLQNTSWIATGFMLTLTSFQPLYGKLSDIFGRKACLVFAYIVFALGCLSCGLARTMTELIAARALAGIGGGGMTTITSIILSDVIPLRSRGVYQGVINIVFASGSAAGAPIGGLLADSIGWRWSFLIQVPATLLAITTVSLFLHLPPSSNPTTTAAFRTKLKRVDFAGAAILISAVLALLLALDRGGNIGWADPPTLSALASFLLLTALFFLVEHSYAREPLAPAHILGARALLPAYLVNFFGFAAGLACVFYGSLYLRAVRGLSAARAGALLLPNIVGGVTGSLAGGLVMRATGRYYWLTVGVYGMLTLGAGVLLAATGWGALVGVEIGLTVVALGNGAGTTTSLIALIANAGAADQAVATALSYLFRSLGSVVGVSVGGAIVQGVLRKELARAVGGDNADEIVRRVRESLSYADTLPPATRALVRGAYAAAVRAALGFALGLAVLAVVSAVFVREKALSR